MPKLIMTKGLPASGKTTYARELKDFKRVNKDDLRSMLDNGKWSKTREQFVLKVRDYIIDTALAHGHNVVVDDTNLAPLHKLNLHNLAVSNNAEFEIADFTDVPLEECIKRDQKRPNYVGEKVIRDMHNTFLKKKGDVAQYTQPGFNPELPFCLIVDIDGTLAHGTGRNMYDYSQVHTDAVDITIRELVALHTVKDEAENPQNYIVIVSGREDNCKELTEQWLKDHGIHYDEIYMRKTGDKRDDRIVKKEIYEEFIKPRFNVRFVLDDRDRVVKMWREEGLKVLQVAEGDF